MRDGGPLPTCSPAPDWKIAATEFVAKEVEWPVGSVVEDVMLLADIGASACFIPDHAQWARTQYTSVPPSKFKWCTHACTFTCV